MKTAQQIFMAFFRQHRRRVSIAFGMGLLAKITALIIPLVIGRHLALRYGYASVRSKVLSNIPEQWFLETQAFLWMVLSLTAAWFAFRYLERYQTSMLGELLVKQLREQLFQNQVRTTPEAFARRSAGKYLLRYSGDLKQIQNLFNLGIMAFVRDLLILVPAAITFTVLLPELALPIFLAFALMILPLLFLNRILYRASVKRRDRRSGLLAFVSDRLYRHGTIQVLNREKPELGKFLKRSDRLTEAGKRYFRIESFIRTMIPSLIYLLPGVIFLWLEWGPGGTATLDPEALSLGALLLLAMAPIFRRLAQVTVHWELGKLSMRKYLAVLNLPQPDVQPDLQWEEGLIELNDLSWEGVAPLNAQIGPTGLTWIQGPTGSGKTKLIRILLRLDASEEGEILVDGQALEDCNPHSVRKRMAVVSAAWPLLGKTVFEAISYSRREEKRNPAERMLTKVQEGVLPQDRLNLEDEIGDQGNRLSGGQATRLLYARALLTRKPILLVDEPFLHLDPTGMEVIQRRLKRLSQKRNLLVFSTQAPPDGLNPDQLLQLKPPLVPKTNSDPTTKPNSRLNIALNRTPNKSSTEL